MLSCQAAPPDNEKDANEAKRNHQDRAGERINSRRRAGVHRAEHGERQRVLLSDEEICARIFIERQQEREHDPERVGQEGANDEFMISQYGALFVNASFGFPGMAAGALPSGGANYPLATPFAIRCCCKFRRAPTSLLP